MEHEYFHVLMRMLKSQLQEEHENYKQSLLEQKEFQHLKNIKQRIKSINASLRLLENTAQPNTSK